MVTLTSISRLYTDPDDQSAEYVLSCGRITDFFYAMSRNLVQATSFFGRSGALLESVKDRLRKHPYRSFLDAKIELVVNQWDEFTFLFHQLDIPADFQSRFLEKDENHDPLLGIGISAVTTCPATGESTGEDRPISVVRLFLMSRARSWEIASNFRRADTTPESSVQADQQ